MKSFILNLLFTISLVSTGTFTNKANAQCGTGTTPVYVNFDWQYFDTLPSSRFQFTFGSSTLLFSWSGTNTFAGTTAAHTGETGSFGSGNDLKFNVSAGADTMTFGHELDSMRFSIYDVDIRTRVTITAFKADNTSQNVILTEANPSGPLTLGGTATAPYGETTSTTNQANTSNNGTLNVRIAGPVKKVVVTITKTSGSVIDSLYFSDITGYLCNTIANWATNYQAASTPEPGQPTYTIAAYNNHIYVVDVTNRTSSILYTDASLSSINSLAYDPHRQQVYYTSNVRTINNRAVYRYDVRTGTKSTFISDILTLGVQLRYVTNGGLGSAAACYYDGDLYIATDANVTLGDATTIWRIDIDSATNTATQASRLMAKNALPNLSTRLFDWSDFVIKNGTIYCFNQSNPSPNRLGAFNISMNAQDTTAGYTTGVRVQMSMDYAEQIYHMGNYGLIETYNGAGGFTTLGSYPRVNAADSIITDGGESFKYPYDYGTDTANYGTAFHMFNTSQNLRLGSVINYGATNNIDGNNVNDNDGVSTFPPITTANASYSVDVALRNETGSTAVLYGYIDFNGDGDFNDPGERSEPVIVPAGSTSATVTWIGLTGGTEGPTAMRLRLAPTAGEADDPNGYASNGETEDYGITVGASTLPVELLSFTGKKLEDNTVELKWATASELNNDYFEVQRSTDFETWEPIGQIKGNGNSRRMNTYVYIDKDPATGNNYYRLKQVDYDSKFELSKVINIKITATASVIDNQLSLYPNPSQGMTTLNFSQNNEAATYEYTIYSMSGQAMYREQLYLESGQHAIQIDAQQFPAGSYIIMLSDASLGKTYQQKFVRL